MHSVTINRLIQEYVLDDGVTDPADGFFGTAFVFALNDKAAYLFGQLSQKRLSHEYYEQVNQRLRDAGFEYYIYYSKTGRVMGGEPLSGVPDLWIVNLNEVKNGIK